MFTFYCGYDRSARWLLLVLLNYPFVLSAWQKLTGVGTVKEACLLRLFIVVLGVKESWDPFLLPDRSRCTGTPEIFVQVGKAKMSAPARIGFLVGFEDDDVEWIVTNSALFWTRQHVIKENVQLNSEHVHHSATMRGGLLPGCRSFSLCFSEKCELKQRHVYCMSLISGHAHTSSRSAVTNNQDWFDLGRLSTKILFLPFRKSRKRRGFGEQMPNL